MLGVLCRHVTQTGCTSINEQKNETTSSVCWDYQTKAEYLSQTNKAENTKDRSGTVHFMLFHLFVRLNNEVRMSYC